MDEILSLTSWRIKWNVVECVKYASEVDLKIHHKTNLIPTGKDKNFLEGLTFD
jgi:hypothetical protein